MEKTMILQAVSPLKEKSFQGSRTGETVTMHFVELTLSDGIDTIVAEFSVPPTVDEQGKQVYRQPEFAVKYLHAVAFEIDGKSGTTADGKDWSNNRIRIRKIVKL